MLNSVNAGKMTERDFCYWLQGFFELNQPKSLTPEQTLEVKKHLYNVFQHECEKLNLTNVDQFYKTQDGIISWPNAILPSC